MSRLSHFILLTLSLILMATVTFQSPSSATAQSAPSPLPLGVQLPEFKLSDFRGRTWSHSDFENAKSTVVIFFGLECPLMKLYAPRLLEIEKQFEKEGVQFIGINSNRQDSLAEIGHFARITNTEFPLLKDPGNKVADQFGAQRTPEVYIFDQSRKLQYRGRIDDQYTYGRQKPKVEKQYLVEALKSIVKGKSPTTQIAEAHGCVIGRVLTVTQSDKVNYANQISRILQKRCVSCHRPGEIGPFSLTDYDEVVGWAEMIKEVINENRMPPWHANPEHGTFANDASLTSEEKKLINTWVDNGAPLGEVKDLPEPRQFAQGWQIGKPDQVFAMSKTPYRVKATGEIPYEYFTVDPGFKEDKWISEAEIRIGNRAVVHHVIVGLAGGRGRHADVDSEWIAACAPGSPPMVLPKGFAKRIPAGSKLVFQMHYTPNGTPAEDISSVGFKYIDEKEVTKEIVTQEVVNSKFRIPAGAENHRVTAYHRFRKDTLILSLFPHMHLRGKAFRYSVKYPGGENEILLDVPNYDFNWQNGYLFSTPKFIPSGTLMTCVAHFDNSEKNIANPDPGDTVRWGDQTWEEMMIGYFDAADADQDVQRFKNSTRTQAFMDALDSNAEPVTQKLEDLARSALNSRKDMNRFSAELRNAFPQIDRVCWTTVHKGKLTVERVGQVSAVGKVLRGSGVSVPARPTKLNTIVAGSKPMMLTKLSTIGSPDMEFMSAVCRSSFHVPLRADQKAGSLNFWSRDANGFPESAQQLLTRLARLSAD